GGNDFFRHASIGDGGRRFLLAAEGEDVLIFACDAELGGHVFGRLRHGVCAVHLLHQRIDEAPAHGGVFEFLTAPEWSVGFGHHEWRARHGFHAARDREGNFAGEDGTCRERGCVEARSAEAIDGGGGNAFVQACE